MKTLDARKKYKDFYLPSAKKVAVVDVRDFLFVIIDGRMEKGHSHGTPPGFQEVMMTLFGDTR